MSPDRSNQHSKIEFQASEELADDLDRVAFEQSSPKNRVTRSDILREAARDYVEKHDEDPDQLSPKDRGSLDGGD